MPDLKIWRESTATLACGGGRGAGGSIARVRGHVARLTFALCSAEGADVGDERRALLWTPASQEWRTYRAAVSSDYICIYACWPALQYDLNKVTLLVQASGHD